MKQLSLFLFISLYVISCTSRQVQVAEKTNSNEIQIIDTSDMTNNFYDNTETYPLQVKELLIEGEIANPGKVDFSELPKHSVIVKETLLDSTGGDRFVGAFRYDGYSLFDILNKSVIKKVNSAEFNPIIDLYVEIENGRGEKVVFSWGEIYYPVNMHKILIASSVSRIVPSKTKELWPLPVASRIVAGNDLVTERNIDEPVKIIVKSIKKSYSVVQGMSPMFSSDFRLYKNDSQLGIITSASEREKVTFNTIFYGRGKGIHSTSPFAGIALKDVIGGYYPVSKLNLQTGILCIAGKDGYRCAVSYSELFNRNDQQEFLLVRSEPNEDGGLYRIFAACDFFSDRAIKSLSEIHLINYQ
jgi:hypothetical protein